ncbi:hypothetical protein SF23_09655 [Streptomyces sp. MBRL 10]|nr:hypothetical protein SF23_09655 [Streptomyces sp. MBRL 10]
MIRRSNSGQLPTGKTTWLISSRSAARWSRAASSERCRRSTTGMSKGRGSDGTHWVPSVLPIARSMSWRATTLRHAVAKRSGSRPARSHSK